MDLIFKVIFSENYYCPFQSHWDWIMFQENIKYIKGPF